MASYKRSSMQEKHCPICGQNNPFRVRYPERLPEEFKEFVARGTPVHIHFRIVQCLNCGLVYSSPTIPEDQIMDLYRHSTFIHEPQLKNMLADYVDQLKKYVPENRRGNLLEIGCSNGFFLREAQELGFKELCGIEPNKNALLNAPSGLTARIVTEECKNGLFPDGYFDVVCFFQVFDHVVNPNAFLEIVRRYLKKGGLLLAIHHNILALMPRVLGSRASTYDISHMHLWDPATMRRILEKNGFKVMAIRGLASRYQLDHVARMLPLSEGLRNGLRKTLKTLGISDATIRASVENMVTVACKEDSYA